MIRQAIVMVGCVGAYITSKKSAEIINEMYKDYKRNKMILTPAKHDFITAKERMN